ncbi:MAG TPA: PAS domain S-box protein [Acidimicrobiia bacterium]|nr:PAS domain S-box protein [Acidimicrobiia bacterium]
MPTDDRPLAPFGEARSRALVVDDEPAARSLLARILRGAGIDTVVASDGKRALEILETGSIHLLILDRHMPGLSGLDVIERVRAGAATAHLPVILITADTDLSDRVYGLEHGADDYLSKPVEAEELVARAHAQLRRRSPDDGIREFVEAANDAFVSWDAAGAILEWTTHAEALFGWTRDEVLGQSFAMNILAPRYRIVHALRMERFLGGDKPPRLGKWFGLTALRNDGREVPVEMTAWLVAHHGHHTFNAFIRDVSKRNAIENALRERARLQTVVEGVTDVIILTDLAGVIVYASPSARRGFGFEPHELFGHLLDEFVHEDDQQVFDRTLHRAIKIGSGLVKAQRIRTRDGRYAWMEGATGVVRDGPTGEVTGLEIVLRDITSRKLADEARKRATGELTRMIKDLRAEVDREHETVEHLRARDRVRTDLVSTVSAELISMIEHLSAVESGAAFAL